MTEYEIIDGILLREGGFTNNPKDKGGPTKFGITAETLGNWRGWTRPANAQEVEDLEPQEAADIYRERYILQPGFTPANIPFEPLRVQMIDFGVNSDPARAIRWLQRVLRTPAITGVLDTVTLKSIATFTSMAIVRYLLNDALVAARSYMIDQAVDSHVIDETFEEGLESRALSFFLSKP